MGRLVLQPNLSCTRGTGSALVPGLRASGAAHMAWEGRILLGPPWQGAEQALHCLSPSFRMGHPMPAAVAAFSWMTLCLLFPSLLQRRLTMEECIPLPSQK